MSDIIITEKTNPNTVDIDISSSLEIAKMINVDSLGYLSIERAKQLAGHNFDSCCTACFSGIYPTDIPKAGAKDKFECKISENND